MTKKAVNAVKKTTPGLVIRGLNTLFTRKQLEKKYRNKKFPKIKKEFAMSASIDWVSATLPFRTKVTIIPHKEKEMIYGWNGYSDGWKLDSGALVYLNPDREEMGLHVRLSGAALNYLKDELHIDPLVLIARLRDGGGKITRLDLAVDVKDGGIDVMEFITLADFGLWEGEPRKHSCFIDGSDGQGKTLYMGRRSSKRYLRIYDKGAQLMTGEDWVRLEVEYKQDVAQNVARELVAAWNEADWENIDSLESAYQKLPGMIKGVVDFPISTNYQKICGKKGIKVANEKKGMTNTEKWLFNASAPVLARLTVEQGMDFKLLFLKHVGDLEQEIRQKKRYEKKQIEDASSYSEMADKLGE
jgi:hypothetical protein